MVLALVQARALLRSLRITWLPRSRCSTCTPRWTTSWELQYQPRRPRSLQYQLQYLRPPSRRPLQQLAAARQALGKGLWSLAVKRTLPPLSR